MTIHLCSAILHPCSQPRVQAELQGIKQQLERCRLGPAEAATPSPRRASLPASSLPASSPTAMAVDEDAADAALFGEDAEAVEPVRPFPSLWAARANDTPLKDFLEMGVSMMYLNIKLSHNVLPSFALRKQKMYVKEIVRTFDFFATDAELELARKMSMLGEEDTAWLSGTGLVWDARQLQSTHAGKPRVAYPNIKRLLIHICCALSLQRLLKCLEIM